MNYNTLRTITLVSYFALIATFFVSSIMYGPEQLTAAMVLAIIKISGLLFVLYGLMVSSKRSYIWLCFILLMYFTYLVLELFMPSTGPLVWVEYLLMALVVICFNAAMLAARFYKPE